MPLFCILRVLFSWSVQPGSLYTQTGPAEVATSCGLPIAPGRLTRASHKQHLTKAYIRVFADLRNIWKQTQRSRPIGKTRKQTPNERTREFSRRQARWNGGEQLIRYKVQSNKDMQQHEKDLAIKKRDQSEVKNEIYE